MKVIQKECDGNIKSDVKEKLIRYFLNNKNEGDFKFWINLIDELIQLIDFSQDLESKNIWGEWQSSLKSLRIKFIGEAVKSNICAAIEEKLGFLIEKKRICCYFM